MDLILKNGKIVILDKLNTITEAIAIKDGAIFSFGKNEDILKLKTEKTKIIDLNKKLTLPGFNESHMHLLNYGYTKQKLILNNCKSIEDLIVYGKEFILKKNITQGKWLLGRGWNQDYFHTKKFPTKEDLDKISIHHPLCYTRGCGHIAVANSAAMALLEENLGIHDENIDFETGMFKESALEILYGMIDAPSVEDIKNMLKDAIKDIIKSGITSVQTDDFDAMPDRDFKKVLKAYEELIEEDHLPVRIYEQCLLPKKDDFKEFLDLGYRTGFGDTNFKIGPLKLLMDGSLGARTALLCHGYNDDPSTLGISAYTQDALDDMVNLAHKNHMQIAIHAIGDKAIYMCLDSFKKANEHLERKDARHGIVHCQITDETILNRMADENILAYIQPIFIDYDMHIVEDRIGVLKSKKTYNWKSMIRKGIKIAGGSDAPVVSFNIFENMYSAITRKDLSGSPHNGWLPEEKLTVDEAVRLFTIDGAYASFEEDIKGNLEIGKLADIVVLSEDIYEIEEDKIKDVEALMTIIGGKIVYEKK
ncbi:amidohydrolase [Lutibacter sp. B2]|nr:amidohydrolase [Lutibacter sp. B2]